MRIRPRFLERQLEQRRQLSAAKHRMRSRSRRPNERRFAAATSTRAGTEIRPIQIPDLESLPRAGASDPRRGLALRRLRQR
jgi:hypothetical protein